MHFVLVKMARTTRSLCAALVLIDLTLSSASRPPVILIPGFAAPGLELQTGPVKLSNCPSNMTWTTIWPPSSKWVKDTTLLACLAEALTVTYDPATHRYHTIPGLHVRPTSFGDASTCSFGQSAFQHKGWENGKDLFGAPYDWRYDPESLEAAVGYFSQLKMLVENVSLTNNSSKVFIVASSQGPRVALAFLNSMARDWKEQHIAALIAQSPVWSGTVGALENAAQGAFYDVAKSLPAWVGRDLFNTWPAGFYNLPRPDDGPYTYNTTISYVVTPNRSYAMANVSAFYRDLGFPLSDGLREHVANLSRPFNYPEVDVHILFGYGEKTPGVLHYPDAFDGNLTHVPKSAKFDSVEGDGLVANFTNYRAAQWADEAVRAKKQLTFQGFKGVGHAQCLRHSNDGCYDATFAIIDSYMSERPRGSLSEFFGRS
eukprot:TRINITY_DN7044_c0_g1_i3.p1 TRINITY_DN7044_c0_g1~~TRINITY_DN7044_c0_g1_i3.p1  ORF type:complete len:429 (+),score=59.17 TRINITY_DN7044_c0_g1_i3:1109-2395(+)